MRLLQKNLEVVAASPTQDTFFFSLLVVPLSNVVLILNIIIILTFSLLGQFLLSEGAGRERGGGGSGGRIGWDKLLSRSLRGAHVIRGAKIDGIDDGKVR